MREIKFRAWSVEHNRMIRSGDADTHLFRKGPIELIHVQWFDGGDEKPEDNKNFTIRQWDDVIYMQYTGLKDEEKKEIYEGDVFGKRDGDKDRHGEFEYHGTVKRDTDLLAWVVEKYNGGWEYLADYKFPRVMGNIYENPELVK